MELVLVEAKLLGTWVSVSSTSAETFSHLLLKYSWLCRGGASKPPSWPVCKYVIYVSCSGEMEMVLCFFFFNALVNFNNKDLYVQLLLQCYLILIRATSAGGLWHPALTAGTDMGLVEADLYPLSPLCDLP